MINRILLIPFLFFAVQSFAQDATEIIRKSEQKMQGESSETTMSMKIVRPKWERTISFKTWSLGTDYSMVLITYPAKEKGQVFLKRKSEMWNYVPSISKMIKLPASMLSQGWMGSDFSNDDLLKESSLEKDYTHKIIGSETIAGYDCWKIELMPKLDAVVVWGKMIKWIEKKELFQMKSEYFDEEMALVKTETASEIKKMDDRIIPTYFELIPAGKKQQKTVMTLESAKFNVKLEEGFFTQQKMKTLK
jgi:outer membrane lipoprotein-sorting protein